MLNYQRVTCYDNFCEMRFNPKTTDQQSDIVQRIVRNLGGVFLKKCSVPQLIAL
jgi:hypothetical protein